MVAFIVVGITGPEDCLDEVPGLFGPEDDLFMFLVHIAILALVLLSSIERCERLIGLY